MKSDVMKNVLVVLGLVALMAIVAVISFTLLMPNSLRLDEAQSLFQTNRTYEGTLRLVAQDVHVPLYHTLLHFWQQYFGNTVTIARSLSLVFFVLTIPATYYLAYYAFKSRSIAFFAALLMAISPFGNWYGSEARMYAQLMFMTVVHQIFFLKIFREAKPDHWILYVITAILGVYTHYFFFFVLLAEVLFFVIARRSFAAKKAFLKFLTSAALVVIAFAPWAYYVFSEGLASRTQPRLTEPSSVDLFNTYSQFLFGFQSDVLNTIIVSAWPIVVLLAFFALQKNKPSSNEVLFFVIAAVFPVLAAFTLSVLVRPFYLSRYLIVALPALLIFISWLIATYPPKLAWTLRGLVAGGAIIGLIIQIASPFTPVKEDYASVSKYLEDKTSSRDVIAASAPFTIYPLEYYYKGSAPLTTIPVWDRFSPDGLPAYESSKLPEYADTVNGDYQTVFLVLSFDQGYQDDIHEYYANRYEELDKQTFSTGITVYQYKLRYDQPITRISR